MDMNIITFKSGKYMYKVTYTVKGGLPSHRRIKREIPTIRPMSSVFYDKYDDSFKEIVYPRELHHVEVFHNDPVENYIHNIMEFMPEWQKIEICDEN